MKDLYYRLGLAVDTDDETILMEAIRDSDRSIREDAAYVLGNSARRAVYDRTHRVLSQIAELRILLGDTVSDANWMGCDDFDISASEQLRRRASIPKEPRTPPAWLRRLILLVVLLVTFIVLTWPFLPMLFRQSPNGQELQSRNPTTTAQRVENADPAPGLPPKQIEADLPPAPPAPFTEPEVPLPVTGIMQPPKGQALAPFRVATEGPDRHYYVKLVDDVTNSVVLTAFVRGGQTLSTQLPLGSFALRYASGREWYGPEHLFGPETAYSEASRTFDFRRTEKGVEGYVVELIPQAGGNLGINSLDASEF